MNKATKKKVMAIVIVFLVVVSSIAIYVALDKLEFFNKPSEPVIEQDEPSEEVLDPTTIKVTELMQQLDESLMKGYIEKLVSFGPHPTARRIPYKLSNRPIIGKFFDLPIEKVAKYIYNEFESYGLKVRYQYWEEEPTIKNLRVPNYYPGWCVGNNIEATLPGTNESSDEIYVLVAHYDTINVLGASDHSKVVGADDDSSGVALLLAAAKLMSQYSFDHTIRFVAVDGEEQGLMGASAYAEEAAKNNDNIVAAFSIDMIGNHGPSFRGKEVVVAGDTDEKSSWITDFAIGVNQRYPEFLNFTIFRDHARSHGSDHRAFLNRGYDAVYVAEAVFDYDWHRKSDTIENMDISFATDVSRLVLAIVAELAWDVNHG